MEWTKYLIEHSYLFQPGPQRDWRSHFPAPGFVLSFVWRLFVSGFAGPLPRAGVTPKIILIKLFLGHGGLVMHWIHFFRCLFGRLCRRIWTGLWFGSVRTGGTRSGKRYGAGRLLGTRPDYYHGGGHPWLMHTLNCFGNVLQRLIFSLIYHGLGHNQQTFLTGCSGAGPKLWIFHQLFPGADPVRLIFFRSFLGAVPGKLISRRSPGMNAESAISARLKLWILSNCAGWPAGGRS